MGRAHVARPMASLSHIYLHCTHCFSVTPPFICRFARQMLFFVVAVLFVFSAAIQAQPQSGSSWPQFRGNNQNTGLSPLPYSPNEVGLDLIWEQANYGASLTPAVGSDGTV
jgi:hypothetical protein